MRPFLGDAENVTILVHFVPFFRCFYRCTLGARLTPSAQPHFAEGDAKQSAISYAKGRTAHRHGEIRVFNAAAELEQSIAFDNRAERQRV